MLATRHHEAHAFVPARVLNMVVIADREYRGEIENRLQRVGRFNPSRLILCSVSEGRETIDASVRIGTSQFAGPGHIAVGHERIGLHIGPRPPGGARHDRRPAAGARPRHDGVGAARALRGDRRARAGWRRSCCSTPRTSRPSSAGFDRSDRPRRARLRRRPRVAALDARGASASPPRSTRRWSAPGSARSPSVTVRHREDSLAAAVLFCGWLSSRLGWKPGQLSSVSGKLTGHARAQPPGGQDHARVGRTRTRPGWPGVTIETASGEAVSLDRSPGRPALAAPRARRARGGLDGAGRLARGGRHPRRGRPAGAAARPDLPARAELRAGVRVVSEPELRVVEDPASEVADAARRGRRGGREHRADRRLDARAGVRAGGRAPDWSGATVWFTDERCVPPDHPDSNFGMAEAALLSRVQTRPAVVRMEGELGPDAGAGAYEAEIRARLGGEPALGPAAARDGPGRAHRVAVPAASPRWTRRGAPGGRRPGGRDGAAGAAHLAHAARRIDAARSVVLLDHGGRQGRHRRAGVRPVAGPVAARRRACGRATAR